MQRSILVIDAIATNRIRFAALLESARYKVSSACALTEYPGNLDDHDLILLGLPDDHPGAALAELGPMIRRSNVPVLCVDRKTSPLRRLLALRAGARDVLPSKSPDDLLLARLRGLIREQEAERESQRRRITAASFGFSEALTGFNRQARVLCVGDLGELPDRLAALMTHIVDRVSGDAQFADDDRTVAPDVIVLNAGCGQRELSRLLPEMRDQTHLRPAPVMVVYPVDKPELAVHALAIGADEVVVDSAGIEEIELRIGNLITRKLRHDALRKSDEQSYRMAMTDDLTGLYNRRYADRYLSGLRSCADGSASGFCVVVVDLDHFKTVNDTHGHAVGDEVLREVARRLASNLRAFDLVARYGGEEFLIILPDTTTEMAAILAERVRRAVSLKSVKIRPGLEVNVTVSLGVAAGAVQAGVAEKRTGTSDMPEAPSPTQFLPVFEAADAALYRAKSKGRNRVEVSGV